MNKLSLKDDDDHADIVNKVKGQAPSKADFANKLSLQEDEVHANIVNEVNNVNQVNQQSEVIEDDLKRMIIFILKKL